MKHQPPSIEKIIIRPASPQDHLTVRTLQIETFRETFAVFNTPENMNRYIEETFNETQVKNELNTADSFFFLAEWEGSPVGYLKLNTAPAQTDIHDFASLEIERIYVKQAMQGKKIGLALMNYALETAQGKNADYVWLGVWENNTPAIVFYKKAGFAVFGEHHFRLGDDIQKDLLMKKSIRSEPNSGVSK